MEKTLVKKQLPVPVIELLNVSGLSNRWNDFDRFCHEKMVQPKDKWVAFFYVALCNQWVTKELILQYLDSVGCELFQVVCHLANFIEKQQLNLKTNENQCNIRQLLLQSIAKPRAVPIYFIALYYQLTQKNEAVYHTEFADRILFILSPLCQHLNLGFIKWRLEDIAFKIQQPEVFSRLADDIEMRREDRDKYVRRFIKSVEILLTHRGIDVVDVKGRAKHLYGIHKKMSRKQVDSSMIFDVAAIRIVTQSVEACYDVLNIIRAQYHEIIEEYDDYISQPKANGYQSIHMAVFGPDSQPVEVQIKTVQMHQFNQYGAAAHWLYKDQQYFGSKMQRMLSQKHFNDQELQKFIFVLTPLGDVLALSDGSTPLDFAYRIHSEIGHQCAGAKVNGQMVQLNTKLQTGDTVEVIKRRNHSPSKQWLDDDYTHTIQAKRHIRHWFSRQERLLQAQDSVLSHKKIPKWPWEGMHEPFPWEFVKERYGVDDKAQLLELMAKQKRIQLDINKFIQSQRLLAKTAKAPKRALKVNQIVYTLAGCCKPVVGDLIYGYVTRSRGMKIHRQDCQEMRNSNDFQESRVQHVGWGDLSQQGSQVPYYCTMICGRKTREMVIENLKGCLVSADWFSDPKDDDLARLEVVLNISDNKELLKIEKSLKNISGVVAFGKRI